jgi:hypothetical protein
VHNGVNYKFRTGEGVIKNKSYAVMKDSDLPQEVQTKCKPLLDELTVWLLE